MSHHARKICPSLHHTALLLETVGDLLQHVEKCFYWCLVWVITFSGLSFWQNMHFVHSVLALTSIVLVVLLWPSEEDEITSSNLRFLEFVDILYHFYITFSLKYSLWNNPLISLYFNKAVVFSLSAHIFISMFRNNTSYHTF